MIDVIQPSLFSPQVKAFFTQKNSHFSDNRLIPGLNVGFNTQEERQQIEENRKIIFNSYSIDAKKVAFGNQVHGTQVVEVFQAGLQSDTDGLITNSKELGLAILVADCAAILLHDEQIGYVGALHAGWRGAIGGILPHTLSLFKAKGSDLSQLKVFISPCISAAKFEVGEEVASQFPENVVIRELNLKPHIDLKAFISMQFQENGVNLKQVEVHAGCTLSDSKAYYSYRREGKQSGRMMAFIQLL
jgi:YfiH family protein